MAVIGHYYLHREHKKILFRPLTQGFNQTPSAIVERIWPFDPDNRMTAWTILLEALAMRADVSEIRRLAKNWGCDGMDLMEFMNRVEEPIPLLIKIGYRLFVPKVLGISLKDFAETGLEEWKKKYGEQGSGTSEQTSSEPEKILH